uniref:Bm1631, isoform a n=1 Tax=Brugia malayi TaxID=6279 RepID=A0A1P6BNG7_BRUMA|nr:Bm1631, isoform a [Brugia malayi]
MKFNSNFTGLVFNIDDKKLISARECSPQKPRNAIANERTEYLKI